MTTNDARPEGDGEMNILIVALDEVTPADVGDAEVLVVAPALNSWLRRWLSDEDAARKPRRDGQRSSSSASKCEASTPKAAWAIPIRCSRSRMRSRPSGR